LGLALCRRIITAHSGSIEALGREGAGLTVRFTLPLA
jgi:two-component system sensor histidine kinase KdpD